MTKLKKGGLLLSVAALLSLAGCTNPDVSSSSSVVPNPTSSESSVVAPQYDVTKITWEWTKTASGYTAKATIPCTNGLPNKVVDATVTSEKTDPTCTVAGSIVYTAKIQFEGNEYQDTKTVTIDALGHEYDVADIEWDWKKKADGSGYDVSAKIPCKRGDDEVVVNDIAVTSKRTEPTCTEDGSIVYTATGTYNDQTLADTKTDPIEKTGHSYDYSKATFVWTKVEGGEGYTVVAKVPCSKGDDTKEVAAEVAETSRTAATCTADGSVTYTATIKDEQNAPYTDTKTDVLAALGHDFDYENLAWEWTESADGYTAKATATCSRDQAKTSADATVTVQTTEATCEKAGQKVYTAKATFNGTEYSATKTVTLPALGHNLQLVAAKDASINATGNSAYYKCDRCGKLFSDEKGTVEINAVPTISWVHVAAIDPTQSARGFKEFYLKSGTGEVSFTAPENAAYSTITLTDEEKTSFINNDTNNVTIPSFDELDAMYSGHEGAMPYDGPFLTKAAAAYNLYSDTAKKAYGKDVDAMLTAFNAAYEVANSMSKIRDKAYLTNQTSAVDTSYVDSTLGTVTHLTMNEGKSPRWNNMLIDEGTKVDTDAKGLVIFVKGVTHDNIKGSTGSDAASTSGYQKFKLGGTTKDQVSSSAIDYVTDGWYAVYFAGSDLSTLITNLNSSSKETYLNFQCEWGSNDIYLSPIYTIKKSNYYGNDVQAFPNIGTSTETGTPTQNYNNASFSDAQLNYVNEEKVAANKVGTATLYNPLLDTNIIEGKGNYAFHFGFVGVDGPNTSAAKGAMKKMVNGTLTSVYFYFYISVDSITASLQVRNAAGNDWVKFDGKADYTYTLEGKGWHKVVIDNKAVIKQFNEADGTKAGWINFTIKSGNDNNHVARMTGIYGTLAA